MSQQLGTELITETALHFKDASLPSMVRPPAILMELVEHFGVCWEIFPEVILVENEKRQVGFALELYGTHEPGGAHPKHRCSHCQNVFAALHMIADWILPRERRASMVGAEVSSPSSSHWPARKRPSGVTFTIRVMRRETYEQPAHECETQWLKELDGRLKELGVREITTQAIERLLGQGRLA
jgi:hypothetical protein